MLTFPKPKHGNWGFDRPNPNLIKVVIDLRPYHMRWCDPSSITAVANLNGHLIFPTRSAPKSGERLLGFPPLMKAEDQRPGPSSGLGPPFGSDSLQKAENQKPSSSSGQGPLFGSDSQEAYFGGPIFDKTLLDWRNTFYTRSNGEVVGAAQHQMPLPFNIGVLVRSTAVMANGAISQSGFWVGPRVFLSTLHFNKWAGSFASSAECEQFKQAGTTFPVESEISKTILTQYSPHVQLIAFSIENDMGLFKLQDHYPDQSNYVDLSWLLERDDAFSNKLLVGSKAGCCGYSALVSDKDSQEIQDQAAHHLYKLDLRPVSSCSIMDEKKTWLETLQRPKINLDHVAKPGLKSFAPGTVDKADAATNAFRYGVSASLWMGASGGPCFLLEGAMAGAIIGTVRGANFFAAPYNSINGFPTGLRDAIRAYL